MATPLLRQHATPQATSTDEASDVWSALQFLWANKWLILALAAASAVATMFWTLQQPKIYQASCTIEYDPSPPRPLGRAVEDVSNPVSYYWSTKEFYKTQNLVIASRSVSERAALKLALHRDPDFMDVPPEEKGAWEGAEPSDAAKLLQRRLGVEQEKDTRIVHVRVRDRDPERAALLANAVTDAYIDKTVDDRLGSTTSALSWLKQQLDGLKGQLEGSELALHKFKEDHNVLSLSLEERQNIVSNKIQRLSQRLTEAQTRRVEAQARVSALKEANHDNPFSVRAKVVLQDRSIENLYQKHREGVAEREALSARYGEAHPEIKAIDARIIALRSQLRSAIDGLISSAESELREVQSVERGVKKELDDAHRAGMDLNLREIEYRRLSRKMENNEKLYGVVLSRTAETDLTRALRLSHVRIVDRALPPLHHVSPRLPINLAIGVLAGMAIAVALALAIARSDKTLRSAAAAEALGVTILGIIPKVTDNASPGGYRYGRRKRRRKRQEEPVENKDLIVHTHPRSAAAECSRTIRTNLAFMSADRPYKSLVVTSASPREGKTTVAINTAIAIAQSGKSVLLVDTDLRKPRIHRVFKLVPGAGITSVLVEHAELESAVQRTEIPGLSVIPCGPIPPNPAELLHTAQFQRFAELAREQFDTIIFDSPPLSAVTDAAIVATQVDGAIVVVRENKTTRDALLSAKRQLSDVSANLLGGIMNDVDLASRKYGYGYGQYYYYYRSEGYYAQEEETRETHRTDEDRPAAS
ncbi:MAG: polysaccharide biosynthesis tyrosine autokinase [Proteobacteria bacterium]|nr:polysaccharide biosynthesis tyrosine autokinase [Pseudomonadota bacterium]